MKIKVVLYVLIFAIHLALLALLIHLFHEKTWILITTELLVLLSLFIFYALIKRILRPVNLIRRGLDMLREEDFTTTLVETGHSDVDELISVFNNMIFKLREEKIAIREQNHFLDLLISSSPMGLIVTDYDDLITSMNPASERILAVKFSEMAKKKMSELPGSGVEDIMNMEFGEKITFSKGSRRYLVQKDSFFDQGFNHPFYLFEELTDEIRQAEKQAYGKVIRMMAHEVNNTVGAVNSIISSVESGTDIFPDENREETAKILKVALERNSQLNRFMQNFSNIVKLPEPETGHYKLNDSINSVVESYRYVLKKNDIDIKCDLVEPSPFITADRSQIEQVIANILKNSIEAIGSGGMISVKTIFKPLSLTIQDNGHGIPDNIRDQLFTPFFTTKTGGQGIGLTLVKEILVNHGFNFELKHSAEKNTEFIIEF